MDRSDLILQAIESMAARMDERFARVEARLDHIETDVSALKSGQARILEHLDVAELKGRVEEQSRAIASLIPTKVAAVPGK